MCKNLKQSKYYLKKIQNLKNEKKFLKNKSLKLEAALKEQFLTYIF